LRDSPSGNEHFKNVDKYIPNLREKLDEIHQNVRDQMEIKSIKIKNVMIKKIRHCFFEQGQKVWFYNAHRKKGKTAKLQKDWEGSYEIVKKIEQCCLLHSAFK